MELRVTVAQATELVAHSQDRSKSRCIQDILPGVDRRLLEIFISGTTPAEWDQDFIGRAKPASKYPGYVKAKP